MLLGMAASVWLGGLASAEDTPLGKQMESLDDAYKAFRRAQNNGEGAASAREAQQAVVKGLSEVPAMLAKMPDGPQRAKAVAAYRHLMGQLYVKLCEVEQAFLDEKPDRVQSLVDEIKELKKKGHDQFMEEE